MAFIKRILFTIICLFAAIACYTFGIPQGGFLFLLAGVIFEGLFWFGVIGRSPSGDGK